MHPLYGALPVPCVPVHIGIYTQYTAVTHWYLVSPHCRTLQDSLTFILLSVSQWNDLADPVFYGVGLACFKIRANAFLLA